jgi:tellurite resistance protein TehA-like permease
MGLDIRYPIGLMFSIIGALMTIYGLIAKPDAAQFHQPPGTNINLVWGIFLLIFGAWMLFMAIRAKKQGK